LLRKTALFLGLLALALLARAPAWLADSALNAATGGAVRLLNCTGSLWYGGGNLTVIDPIHQQSLPWVSLDWRWRPSALFRAEAAWSLITDGRPAGELGVSPRGYRAEGLSLSAPARFALERIPHAFGRLGWRGDMQLDTTLWRCDWRMHCDGRVDLRWSGASVDVLRGRLLGDYLFGVRGDGQQLNFSWNTTGGETRVEANGAWQPGGAWNFAGTVRGDPVFLQRLPAVAGRWVTPTGTPGEFSFSLTGGPAGAAK